MAIDRSELQGLDQIDTVNYWRSKGEKTYAIKLSGSFGSFM